MWREFGLPPEMPKVDRRHRVRDILLASELAEYVRREVASDASLRRRQAVVGSQVDNCILKRTVRYTSAAAAVRRRDTLRVEGNAGLRVLERSGNVGAIAAEAGDGVEDG
jgi:hypothetical protein